MSDLTKLAEALENTAKHCEVGLAITADATRIREAARILRSAAGVDVAGLMAMVDEIACAAWTIGTEEPSAGFANKELPRRAALESALRLALAAREGFVMVPVEPDQQMVKAGGEEWRVAPASIGGYGAVQNIYRAMIAAAPKGTT